MGFTPGEILEGKVSAITKFGAFVVFENGKSGMVHISEVAPTYVKDITEYLQVGQAVKVCVISCDEKGKLSLSIKKVAEAEKEKQQKKEESKSFEDMLSKFMSDSSRKISDLNLDTGKRNRRR